jgi:hypothetical protein
MHAKATRYNKQSSVLDLGFTLPLLPMIKISVGNLLQTSIEGVHHQCRLNNPGLNKII